MLDEERTDFRFKEFFLLGAEFNRFVFPEAKTGSEEECEGVNVS